MLSIKRISRYANVIIIFAVLCLVTSNIDKLNAQSSIDQFSSMDGVLIPLTYDPPAKLDIIINVRINDSKPLPFILDTGANLPVLVQKWAAEIIGLTATGQTKTVIPNDMVIDKAGMQKIAICGNNNRHLIREKSACYIADLPMLQDTYGKNSIAGIIGAPILANTTTQIDFASELIKIVTLPHQPLRSMNATVVPIKELDTGRFFVSASPSDNSISDMLIDTGAYWTVIPKNIMPKVNPLAKTGVAGSSIGISLSATGIDGKSVSAQGILLDKLKIGSFDEPIIPAIIATNDTGILGLQFLSRFKLILDFRHKEMLMVKSETYAKHSKIEGFSGIKLVSYGEKIFVLNVIESSPAEKAGVAPEDEVVAVNGEPIRGLSCVQAQRLIDGYAGTKAIITLKQLDKRLRNVTFTRTSIFGS